MLKGELINLRPLEHSDLEFLYSIENNKDNWIFGSENKIFSYLELENYIKNSSTDIKKDLQHRFVIDYNGKAVGFIDLFNYCIKSVDVGIIVANEYRGNGYAKEALKLLIEYSFSTLKVDDLCCTISNDNIASINFFTSFGFRFISTQENLTSYVLENNL